MNDQQHNIGVDALRHAVRTQPMNTWGLIAAANVMRQCRDFQQIRMRNGLYSWSGTQGLLDSLVQEGWLHRPDGVHYVPTEAARSTWPKSA